MRLYNTEDSKVLKDLMKNGSVKRLTISFYKYHFIEEPQLHRDELYQLFQNLDVMGRIYVAHEGVNAQISVPKENFESFRDKLYRVKPYENLRLNVAVEDDGKSFFKLVIKVRTKIVADGLDDNSFDSSNTGEYLTAEEFNKLTDDPETIVVDMRNHYESEVGHFKGAILPDADTFREELPMVNEMLNDKKEKNIVMYCTGGIRCEKATAWFKHQGYENVFHLEGGIIKYAHDIKTLGLENKFVGKNFVFDERLGERISEDVISKCHQCGKTCDTHVNCANDACHLLFIQCEECAEKYDNCCSSDCKEVLSLTDEEQKKKRKGKDLGRQVFKKGRFKRSENGDLINLGKTD